MKSMKRQDSRVPSQMRKIKLTRQVLKFADSSCLVEWGDTKVMCTATMEERVPSFLRNSGTGWVTAEYGMLPASSSQRIQRESVRGRLSGRTQEIQRLIGRSMRSVVDLRQLGERTIIIDCDVIQADGGTRCASITGGFVALFDLFKKLRSAKTIPSIPVSDFVAATSVGIVRGEPMLDLNYSEDSSADVDMNIVMTDRGRFIEVQGTAERNPFSSSDLTRLISLASRGIRQLIAYQKRVLKVSPTQK